MQLVPEWNIAYCLPPNIWYVPCCGLHWMFGRYLYFVSHSVLFIVITHVAQIHDLYFSKKLLIYVIYWMMTMGKNRDIAFSCPSWLWCEGTAELTKVIRHDKDYIGWNVWCVSASNSPLWLSSSVIISYTFNITEKQQNHKTCRDPQSEHIHISVIWMSKQCYISVWGKLVDTLLNALLPQWNEY